MQQLLHQLGVEYQTMKYNDKIRDISIPEINGNSGDISGFNMLIAILYASNRRLSGAFTTIDYLKEREIPYKGNCPKLYFVDYEVTDTILFLESQVKDFIQDFNPELKEDIEKAEKLFVEGKINSFSPQIKQEVEQDLGRTYELNLGRNIINYRKIEAVPNEYIYQSFVKEKAALSQEEKELKNEIENRAYSSFEHALQELYILFYNYGVGNPKMIKDFELYDFEINMELLLKSNNNAIIAKSIVEKERREAEVKQIKR